jgi:hypothetical protein
MLSSRQTIQAFVKLLLSHPAGQIVACNIVCCWRCRVVDRAGINDALSVALDQFERKPPADCKQLIGLLETAWQAHCFHGPQARRTGRESGKGLLYNIIRYDYFTSMLNWDTLAREGLCVEGDPCTTAGGEVKMDAVNNLSGRDGVFKADCDLGRATLWLTPDDLGSDKPDRIRDALGLIQHGTGKTLVRLTIPAATANAIKSFRPTFAAAGSHRRFQQRPDRRTPRGLGRTVDLDRHNREPMDNPVSGPIEIIARPQKIEGLSASWTCLGPTVHSGEPESMQQEFDERFVKRMWRDRDGDKLRRLLVCLCKPLRLANTQRAPH